MVRLVIFRIVFSPVAAALGFYARIYGLPKPDPGFLYPGRGGLLSLSYLVSL